MRRSQIALLRWTLLQAFAGGLFWMGYVSLMDALGLFHRAEPVEWRVFLFGALFFGAMAAFEFYIWRAVLAAPLRRLPLLASAGLRTAILLAIAAGILATVRLPAYLGEGLTLGDAAVRPGILRDAAMATIVTFAFVLWSEIRALIGPRTLFNVIAGKYHKARRENRIFVFIDMRDSTPIAARIGDERFHAFLSRFFFDIDEILVDHGGEVHSYVGDAVIVTWPLSSPKRNANALRAVFALRRRADTLAARYRSQFGVRARVRVAMHGGAVVAGECGSSKKQITYLGDVVNVTARLEQAAKDHRCDVIISQALLDASDLPEGIRAVPLGALDLKGQPLPVEALALKEA